MRGSCHFLKILGLLLPVVLTGMVPLLAAETAIISKRGMVESWREQRTKNVSLQEYDYSCGTASIVNLIRISGGDEFSEVALLKNYFFSLPLERRKKITMKGLSLYDMSSILKSAGYPSIGVKFDRAKITALDRPMIVHLELDDIQHFAVLEKLTSQRAYLLDPSRGRITLPVYKFFSEWSGAALLLDDTRQPNNAQDENMVVEEPRPLACEAARSLLR